MTCVPGYAAGTQSSHRSRPGLHGWRWPMRHRRDLAIHQTPPGAHHWGRNLSEFLGTLAKAHFGLASTCEVFKRDKQTAGVFVGSPLLAPDLEYNCG
jgi:hypothetical protein